MKREPRLAVFVDTDQIVLEPVGEGGWVVRALPDGLGVKDVTIGAFTDVHDMLAALSSALLPEDVGPTIEDRVAGVLFPEQESGRLRRGGGAGSGLRILCGESPASKTVGFKSTRSEGS